MDAATEKKRDGLVRDSQERDLNPLNGQKIKIKKLKMGMFGGTEEPVTQAPDWQLEMGGRVRVSGARRVCLKLTWVVPG